jgi:phage-related protein|tara:strand:- start:2542 stop:2940 length:399 start_codon:yes stop_codon:yes gene_type:complete
MADIGFTVPGISAQVVPDKGLSRSSKPRVRVAQFGDGYQQRVADGINATEESFSVSFSNRSKAEADDINAFFVLKKGVIAFNFTVPDSNSSTNDSAGSPVTTVKVICSEWQQSYTQLTGSSISATFTRVYEP